jgi:hypothetical protein
MREINEFKRMGTGVTRSQKFKSKYFVVAKMDLCKKIVLSIKFLGKAKPRRIRKRRVGQSDYEEN